MQLKKAGNPAAGANASSRMNRVSVGLHVPTLETLGTNDAGYTPAATVAYVSRANLEFVLPDQNTLQNRKDLRKFMDYLCANAQLVAMVENLQNVY
jgi:predicted nucleotidyltransferase